MNNRWHIFWQQAQTAFAREHDSHWAHMSRLTHLLIVLNISFFFMTQLVTRQGYYYTYFSLLFLSLVVIGILLPLGRLHKLWYYTIFLVCDAIGIHFFVVSVWYWVSTNTT